MWPVSAFCTPSVPATRCCSCKTAPADRVVLSRGLPPACHSRGMRSESAKLAAKIAGAALAGGTFALGRCHRTLSYIKRGCLDQKLEELDRYDPGRSGLRGEWAVPGEVVFEEQTATSGHVCVSSSGASRGGCWRRLRFNGSTEQSVVLLDEAKQPVTAALAFGYLKTLAAVGASLATALGRPVPLRVLIIGVGLGALPNWFTEELGASVDAVELDAAVLRAATEAGGLQKGVIQAAEGAAACVAEALQAAVSSQGSKKSLHVYCCDGVAFVKEAASVGLHYDVVIVDVFDGQGATPEEFLHESFGQALGSVSEAAVANLTCPVPMWEDTYEWNAPQAGALAACWRRGFGQHAGVWSVRVAEGQNIIPAVTSVGAPPDEFLSAAACKLFEKNIFAFDPVKRVSFRRQEWAA
eukprot:TRINITY_DN49268_c0_g1_i1.p1 TRINITY_DN49268_c0_g1~~TRINITY_DN49268_c0_g1_i1.p1  ORF type:complete len:411 (+),score=86.68 TRINITY_DN49268_c0_g1_i1:38-1270(+)